MIDSKPIINCLEQAIVKSKDKREDIITFSLEAVEAVVMLIKMLDKKRNPDETSVESNYSKIHDKTLNNPFVSAHWRQFLHHGMGWTEMLEFLSLTLIEQNEMIMKQNTNLMMKRPPDVVVIQNNDNGSKAIKFTQDTQEFDNSVMDGDNHTTTLTDEEFFNNADKNR